MIRNRPSIETHGKQSPGYVGGDFKITQTIINQYNESQRKRWRKLDEIDYPALVDDDDRRTKYAGQLALHLHRAFKDTGFISFTSLISLNQATPTNTKKPIPTYCLITHQAKFSGSLRYTWKYLHNPQGDITAKQAYQDELNCEITKLMQTWSFDLSLPFANRLVASQFVYDPDARRIRIGKPEHISTNPSSFPDKVRTTSELLAFLSATIGTPGIFLGDIACISSYYPLFKVVIEILDHNGWQLDKIRVNANDCEQWDYINTDADQEIRRYSEDEKKA